MHFISILACRRNKTNSLYIFWRGLVILVVTEEFYFTNMFFIYNILALMFSVSCMIIMSINAEGHAAVVIITVGNSTEQV